MKYLFVSVCLCHFGQLNLISHGQGKINSLLSISLIPRPLLSISTYPPPHTHQDVCTHTTNNVDISGFTAQCCATRFSGGMLLSFVNNDPFLFLFLLF